MLCATGKNGAARDVVEIGLRCNPGHPALLADRLILSANGGVSQEFRVALARLADVSLEETNRAGVALWENEQYEHAVTVFQGVVTAAPRSATAWTNLAVNQMKLGKGEMAEAGFRQAVLCDALNDFAKRSFDEFVTSRRARTLDGAQ
jgi:hypothetical protein